MTTEICGSCHGIGGHVSQQDPARIVSYCNSCGGSGEIEVDE